MIKNRLKDLVWFWALWEEYKKQPNAKWSDLTIEFKNNSIFDIALKKIEDKVLNNNIDLFNQKTISKEKLEIIKTNFYIVYKKIENYGIQAVVYDQFKRIPAFKDIKDVFFFFIKGNKSILENNKDKFVSVVGSRKTPIKYNNWIEKNIPNKIIISGLAYGADLMAHKWAIKNKLNIIVFPGIDIYKKPKDIEKLNIYNYAIKNGLLISSIFPGSKSFDKSIFLKRNKWMSQMSSESYAIYFKEKSGTLGHILESAKNNLPIFMPKDVLEENRKFLENNNSF